MHNAHDFPNQHDHNGLSFTNQGHPVIKADSSAHGRTVLVIRPYTGLAGDIIVAGLARLLEADQTKLDGFVAAIGLPSLENSLNIVQASVNSIGGWQCKVQLAHAHCHRTLADILGIIEASALNAPAKQLAADTFRQLAEVEGAVHAKAAKDVAFHEVGALDSILDICLAASMFDALKPERVICGPLPICDGSITCAHGQIPAPAPAVMRLLQGMDVCGINTTGETITPTGVALLKAFGVEFAPWPAMRVERQALVYGTTIFPNVPNGTIFAYGKELA